MKNEKFKYSGNFKKIFEKFIKNGNQQKAQYWLDNLLQRQSYDKKFKKLDDLQRKIEQNIY